MVLLLSHRDQVVQHTGQVTRLPGGDFLALRAWLVQWAQALPPLPAAAQRRGEGPLSTRSGTAAPPPPAAPRGCCCGCWARTG